MNRRGFTLVELLAVLIILGIIVGIVITSLNTNLDSTKKKTEEVFIGTIKDALEMYLDSSDSRKLNYSDTGCSIKKSHGTIGLYKSNSISFSDVFSSEYSPLTESDFVNPNNENEKCNVNSNIISIYRDDDYVYYYMVKSSDISCLTTDEVITTLPQEVLECLS